MDVLADNERLPALLERELQGLKDLLNVAQVVVSSLDLDEVLHNILISAMTMVEVPAGSIALYDEAGSSLELHAHAGLSEAFTARDRWQVEPGGLTHEILDRGELFIIEDTEQAGFFNNPLALAEGIRSLIAVPLRMQRKVVGVLYLDDFQPRRFAEERLRLLAVLASFASMSIDNARLHKRTVELACTDGLTGLFNHRHFKQMFAEGISRAARYQKPLSIVLFDIDNFKMFNDRYGHPNGDIVLREMARLLRELLRGCDSLFRYGGEEFVALLPETTFKDALQVAERIRALVEHDSPKFLSELPAAEGVTVSVGVATFPDDGGTLAELLKAVDELMYEAKRKGKNKVHFREREQTCQPSAS